MHSKIFPCITLICALLAGATGCSPQQAAKQKTGAAERPVAEEKSRATSTRAENVTLLPDSVTFQGQSRTLWVYLPPGYALSKVRYNVVYMHDGQNVFDDTTSYAGEWGVDETLNKLAREGYQVPIVVAVEHGGDARMQELSPWTNPEYGEARGEAYLSFIVEEVKPLIDRLYRTQPGAMSTAIMGSSMGGLMSHYALVSRPDIFSKAAVFSPSFWYSDNAFHVSEAHPLPESHKLFMVVGQKEDDKMVNGMQAMLSLHLAQQHPETNIVGQVVPGQSHNEAFWQQQVAGALIWLSVVK